MLNIITHLSARHAFKMMPRDHPLVQLNKLWQFQNISQLGLTEQQKLDHRLMPNAHI